MSAGKATITVGSHNCHIPGFTSRELQQAVDRAATAGGGTVTLSPGVYTMDNAVQLRNGVTLRGAPDGQTILRKTAMRRARVTTILGYGHNDLLVDNPDIFRTGDGILVASTKTHGFLQTTGTLTHREGNTWFLDSRYHADYADTDQAAARTLHALVSAIDIADATVENLVLEGNAAENEYLNGCRGAAFYALRAQRITARHILARDFNGDGFSFQTSDDVSLLHCQAEACTGNGFHPGSGSYRFHIGHCAARHCHGSGLFYCLRVRDGLLENSTFEENRQHGISIWARDDHHLNRNLAIRHNGGCGIHFVPVPASHASNNHTFENCILENNCTANGQAEILIQGGPRGTVIKGANIMRQPRVPGIVIAPGTPPVTISDTTVTPPDDPAIPAQ